MKHLLLGAVILLVGCVHTDAQSPTDREHISFHQTCLTHFPAQERFCLCAWDQARRIFSLEELAKSAFEGTDTIRVQVYRYMVWKNCVGELR